MIHLFVFLSITRGIFGNSVNHLVCVMRCTVFSLRQELNFKYYLNEL